MNSNLATRLEKTGMLLFMVAAFLTFFNGLFLPFGRMNYHYGFLGCFLSMLLFLSACFFLHGKLEMKDEETLSRWGKTFGIGYLAVTFVLHLILGYWMEYTPLGDNLMLYQGALALAQNGAFEKGSDFILYFCRFSNQWGFLLYLSVFFRVFFALGGTNPFYALVIVESLLYLGAGISLFKLARRISGSRGVLLLGMMLVCCLPMLLASCVLYTDTFSMPFVIWTLSTAERVLHARNLKKRIKWAVICAMSAVFGGQIKMTVAITLIAACILWLIRLRHFEGVLCVALCGAVMAGGSAAVHHFVLHRYLDEDIYRQENTPIIHWIMMSIPDGDNPYGGYSQDYALTWKMMDEGASHKEVMESIYSRMKDKIYSLRYPNRLLLALFRKNSASFSDGTFGMTEMLDDKPIRRNILSEFVLEDGKYYKSYMELTSGIWFGVLLVSLLRAFSEYRRGRTEKCLIYVSLLGVMLFLMIWEARGRYLFNYIPVFLLAASLPIGDRDISGSTRSFFGPSNRT